MKVFLPPLIFLLSMIGIHAHAQTKVYATSLVSSSHTTNVGNNVDGNESTRSIIESHAGYLLGIGSYDGHVELQFPTMVPANQTFYLRINTEENILDALLGGTLGDILSGIVGGLAGGSQNFTISVKNNTTEVMSLYSGFLANFSGDQGKIVSDVAGNYYLAITPPQAYNRVRITNNLNSLLGLGNKKTIEVWDAYYVSEPDMCNDPKFTSYDVTGVNLDLLQLSDVSANNERAIDGDMNTKSTLSFGVLAVGATVIQRAHFESPSIVGEEFGIRFGSSTDFLSLNLFTNLRVKAMKGTQVVYNEVLDNVIPQAIRDSLTTYGKTTFYFTPNASVDKISFEYTAVLGLNVAQNVDIYEFIKRPASPILDVNASNLTICQGTSATVQAATTIPNATIYYYETLTSTTPLASAPSGQAVTFGSFFTSANIYAAAGFLGCPTQSRRVAIPINVIDGPSASDLAVPNLLPIYCASNDIVLQAQSLSGNVTRWHLTNTFSNIIFTDTIVNGVTYTVNPATQELTITGAQISNNPIEVFLSTFNPVTGCWSAPGGLLPVTVNLQDEPAPTLTAAFPPTCLIEGSTLADISVSPTNVIWYDEVGSSNVLPASTIMQPGQSYYAATNGANCISAQRLAVSPTILDEPAPTTLSNNQFFCTADNATLDNLQITGVNIQWYDSNNVLLPNTTVVQDGVTYYATSQGADCESATKLAITTTISDLPTPTTNDLIQYFCPQDNPTVDDIEVTSANVSWFLNPTGGTPLPAGTPLNNGQTYYGAIMSQNCSSSIRLAVTTNIETVVPATAQDVVQIFCAPINGGTPLTLEDLAIQPQDIVWYSTINGTTPLASTTPLVNNTTYYAAAMGQHCESATRIFIHAVINEPSTPTTVDANQNFCSSTVPTISDIVVSQNQVVWYDAPNGTALTPTTPLIDGASYYGYLVNQGCMSPTPLEVVVNYEIVNAPVFTSGTQFFCPQPSYLGDLTIADLDTEGQNIEWYETQTSSTPLAPSIELVSGATYYASTVGQNCISTLRTPVYVVLEQIAVPTTSDTTQLFCRSTIPTIADISISPVSVYWYDAEFGGNLLDLSEPLVNNAYYYAAGFNGSCESGKRRSVLVNFEVVSPVTTNESIQYFCPPAFGEPALTIADLAVDTIGFGNDINLIWYDASTGGNTLTDTTPLVTNTTYYATKEQGLCQGEVRTPIFVIIDGITTPGSVNIPQTFCDVDAPTVADLQILNPNMTWFDVAIGGTAMTSTETLVNGQTYYAELFNNNCSSPSRLPVTVNVEIVPPTVITNSVQIFCPPIPGQAAPTLSDLNVDGQTIVWYTSANGGSILPASTPLVHNTTYYASVAGTECNSPERAPVIVQFSTPITPTTSQANQHFCAVTAPTIDMLQTNQPGVSWYMEPSLVTAVPSGTTLIHGQTYYGTLLNLNGCQSTTPLAVTVTIDMLNDPTAMSGVQFFCNTNNNTLADVDVQGMTVQWFDAPTNGNALAMSTPLVSGTTYYAFTSNGTCLSTSAAAIHVQFETIPVPTGDAIQNFCSGNTPTVADLAVNEGGVVWYTTLTGGTQLANNTPLVHGQTYYATVQTQNCSSSDRFAVTVNVENVPTPTTTENTQIFCGSDVHTLADLAVTGTNIVWYSTPTSTTPLASTTVLQNNTIYFAANAGTGCESVNRLAIYVIVENLQAPTATETTQYFCTTTTPTVAEINVTPSNTVWYDAANTIVYGSSPIVDGATYYAYTQGIHCTSTNSLAITVYFNNPTGGQVTMDNPSPCYGDEVIYTAPAGMTDYTWTVTGGNTIAGGTSTSNTITVEWTSTQASLNLSYTAPGNCVVSLPTALTIDYANCSDLSVVKTANSATAFVGDQIEFTIVVTNTGNGSQSNIVINEVIQNGFAYIAHTADLGTYSPVAGQWTIPSMGPNSTATLKITVEVLDGGNHTNLAYVFSTDIIDFNPGNDSSLVEIDVECLVVYNEISPNGDGKNDVFYVDCLGEYQGNSLSIFNRHGNLVYQVDDYKNDWNGVSNIGGTLNANEGLPAGTYFYVLKVKGKEELEKSGWVYIIR